MLVITSLSIISCQKDVIQNALNATTNYLELIDMHNNNGSISFSSNKGFGQDAKAVFHASSVLFDDKGNQIKLRDLQINDLIVKPTQQGIISTDITVSDQIGSLYGKKLIIEANKEKTDLNTRGDVVVVRGEIRLPKEIIVSSPTSLNGKQNIRRNETIKWVADPSNKKKMLVVIEFDPIRGSNKNFRNNKATANYIEVDDTGTYQFKPQDFKGIPNKSTITIYVTRADYTKTTSTTGSEKYTVYGYTMARADFVSE